MIALLLLCLQDYETRFRQIHPEPATEEAFERWDGQARAIVMIQGLKPHPLSEDKPNEAVTASWQNPDSTLAKALKEHADLYIFSYAQNRPVGEIPDAKNADGKSFGDYIEAVRALGYGEIVFVGFSAGGLIARQFVEDHPDAGVTRVVQVCSPNGGSSLGGFDLGVRGPQEPFLNSLKKEARREFLAARADKKIPDAVEFVVVMGTGAGDGDSAVSRESAWPQELRLQGVPVVELNTLHFAAVRGKKGAALITELATTPQPRWSAEQLADAEKALLD